MFYGEIELAQNFEIKYKTSIVQAMRGLLFATMNFIRVTVVILARNILTKSSIFPFRDILFQNLLSLQYS